MKASEEERDQAQMLRPFSRAHPCGDSAFTGTKTRPVCFPAAQVLPETGTTTLIPAVRKKQNSETVII